MYRDNMVSVGKVENGFIVECRVRFKKDAKKTEKMSFMNKGMLTGGNG